MLRRADNLRWGVVPALLVLAGPAFAGAAEAENAPSHPYLEVEPIVEFAYFDNADGVWGQGRWHLTTGVGVAYEDWNLAVSTTGRTTTMPGAADIDDCLLQLSAGYALADGLALDAGWAWIREEGEDSCLVGVLLAHEFGFCLGCNDGNA